MRKFIIAFALLTMVATPALARMKSENADAGRRDVGVSDHMNNTALADGTDRRGHLGGNRIAGDGISNSGVANDGIDDKSPAPGASRVACGGRYC
jgi:hypothetical protein